MCVGDYVFTVDCHCHNVNIIFTDNETNSVRRRHVLRQRELKKAKKCRCDRDEPEAASHDDDSVDDRHSTATSAAATSDTAAAAAELSDDADIDADLSDAGSETDEDTDSLSSHIRYTKDAFHKFIIAG